MQTHWRLAFMLDAPDGDLGKLEENLGQARERIYAAANGNAVRLGVALPPVQQDDGHDTHDTANLRSVDGAVEVTVPNGDENAIPGICRELRPVLQELAKPGSLEVMTGAMHHMVPVRAGEAFLSLAFARYPGTTIAAFQDWWLNTHSKIAIPVLGEELLAYDQVHVDLELSLAAADALGVPFVSYDAYDNLTFHSRQGFNASISDIDGMSRIAEDEAGRIDYSTRRSALMRKLV